MQMILWSRHCDAWQGIMRIAKCFMRSTCSFLSSCQTRKNLAKSGKTSVTSLNPTGSDWAHPPSIRRPFGVSNLQRGEEGGEEVKKRECRESERERRWGLGGGWGIGCSLGALLLLIGSNGHYQPRIFSSSLTASASGMIAHLSV